MKIKFSNIIHKQLTVAMITNKQLTVAIFIHLKKIKSYMARLL